MLHFLNSFAKMPLHDLSCGKTKKSWIKNLLDFRIEMLIKSSSGRTQAGFGRYNAASANSQRKGFIVVRFQF
jgi:hypothetical protein